MNEFTIRDRDAVSKRVDMHLQAIGEIGRDPQGNGWARIAFSASEDEVHEYARVVFSEIRCDVRTDSFGNSYGRRRTGNQRMVMLGTHLDTVPWGGNYDGVVGFITAVESIRLADTLGIPMPSLELTVFRAEESTRFSKSCLGSLAAFGMLARADLDKVDCLAFTGARQTLDQLLRARQCDISQLGARLVDPADYSAYLESHIEQARVLEAGGEVGIVTSIRAAERRPVVISGERAVQAAAWAILAVERTALLANAAGDDLVATVGRCCGFFRGAGLVNTIPGRVSFELTDPALFDLRSARRLASARGCGIRLEGATVVLLGTTDHSGGTPMGRAHRRDALAAASDVVRNMNPRALSTCKDLEFTIDVRSNSEPARQRAVDFIRDEIEKRIADVFRVQASVHEPKERGVPVGELSADLQSILRHQAEQLGLKWRKLPSGAGHDAMIAFRAGIPTAMIFIPCRNGLSHTAAEHASANHIVDAVLLTTAFLHDLAREQSSGEYTLQVPITRARSANP